MGRGQELLEAARNADRSTVERIIGQITRRSGPFPRYVPTIFMFLGVPASFETTTKSYHVSDDHHNVRANSFFRFWSDSLEREL